MNNKKHSRFFIRAQVNHFDLDTLIGRANNPPKIVSSIISACPYQLADNKGFISGDVFQCSTFLSFVTGGNWDEKKLFMMESPVGYEKPTEFTLEKWQTVDEEEYVWRLTEKTHVTGVKWIGARHTSDGDTSCCAGEASFSYENKTNELQDGPEITIDAHVVHPSIELRRVLEREYRENNG